MEQLQANGLKVISIHTPAWGATVQDDTSHGGNHISIHTPAWGATVPSTVATASFVISIHTPAWGATVIVSILEKELYISIHTPAWGATREEYGLFKKNEDFNPHSRVGSDGCGMLRNADAW